MGINQFFILKGDRMFFLHQHTSYCKLAYIGMYLKWFSKIKKLENKQDFFLSTPQMHFPIPLTIQITTLSSRG